MGARRPRWRRFAVLAAVLVSAWVLVVLGLQRHLIFPRHLVVPLPEAGADVRGLETLWHDTDQGKVEAWFLPGQGVSASAPGPVVVFAHGNGELIDFWPEQMAEYRRFGVSVLLPEYRGYGRSAGSPSEKSIVADYVALFDRLVARPDVDADRVILHGRSLGGGVVCGLARERPVAGMILQSTFTSVADLARRWLVPRFLVLDPFDNLAAVGALDIPILVMHGRRDQLIPVAHAHALHQAARDAQLVLYDADHNDFPPPDAPYWQDIRAFLVRTRVVRGVSSGP